MKRFALLLLVIGLVFTLFACVGGDESGDMSDFSIEESFVSSAPEVSDDMSEDGSVDSSNDFSFEGSADESVDIDESLDSSDAIVVVTVNDIAIDDIREILFSEFEAIKSEHGEPTHEYTLESNERWYYFEALGFSIGILPDSTSVDHILIHSESALFSLGITSDKLVRVDGVVAADMTFGEVEDIWGESEVQSIYDKASGKRTYFAEYSMEGLLFEISTSLSDGSEEAHVVDKILITKE